jgi:hypothetical protein
MTNLRADSVAMPVRAGPVALTRVRSVRAPLPDGDLVGGRRGASLLKTKSTRRRFDRLDGAALDTSLQRLDSETLRPFAVLTALPHDVVRGFKMTG